MGKKTKRKRIKLELNKLIIVCIMIYILFNFINRVMASNITLETIRYGNIENKLKKYGIIIKDEEVLYSYSDGYISFLYDEHERVQKNSEIAIIKNSDTENLVVRSKSFKDKTNYDNNNLNLDINVDNNIYKIKNIVMNDHINIGDLKKRLSYEKFESNDIMGQNLNSGYLSKIKTEKSGELIFSADGYEDFYKFENIQDISINNFEETTNKNVVKINDIDKKVLKGDPIGKIVNNHEWYVAFLYDKKEFTDLRLNKKITLEVDDITFRGVLKEIKEFENKNILIFKIYDDKWKFEGFRRHEFYVIENKYEGIKIPKKAIVELNSKKGVFILSDSGTALFKELKCIIGEDKDYIVLDYKKIKREQIKTIDLYDDVILNPENVENGKRIR